MFLLLRYVKIKYFTGEKRHNILGRKMPFLGLKTSFYAFRIWIDKPKIACFDIQESYEPNAALAQIVGKSGGDMGFC